MKFRIIGIEPTVSYVTLYIMNEDKDYIKSLNPAGVGIVTYTLNTSMEYLKRQIPEMPEKITDLVGRYIETELRWKMKNTNHRYYYLGKSKLL